MEFSDLYSDSESDDQEMQNMNPTYKTLLQQFTEQWLLNEVHHRVSKEASNALFELSKKWLPDLLVAKTTEGKTGKIPQFVHMRRQIYKKRLPPIDIEVSYRHRSTGEVHVLQNLEKAPTGQFPPNEYQKLYEIASVKVYFEKKYFPHKFRLFSQFSQKYTFLLFLLRKTCRSSPCG